MSKNHKVNLHLHTIYTWPSVKNVQNSSFNLHLHAIYTLKFFKNEHIYTLFTPEQV